MPTSARKSSIAPRRGPQKYIPYRADDLGHGKRTGVAVGYVDYDSDGFEPFEKLMGQADLRTPPKAKVQGKKKRGTKTPVVEQFDEDGEMSMELDESMPNSPATYFSRARAAGITSSVQRIGSSSRPVPRHSDIDFDKIPSPRNASSAISRRSSTINGISAGPSHLSRSMANDMDEDSSDAGGFNEPFDGRYDDAGLPPSDPESDLEATPVPQPKQSLSVRRPKFSDIAQDEETQGENHAGRQDEVEEVERHVSVKHAKDKGKGKLKRALAEEDISIEDDIAEGLQGVDDMPEEYFAQEGQEEAIPEPPARGKGKGKGRQRDADDSAERPKKKARAENAENEVSVEKPKKARGKPRKENVLREVIHDQNVDDDGVRRSSRMRYKPLDWWRNEKVVYGRRDSGQQFVPTIKEIRRIPKEESLPLGAKHRRKRPPRSGSKTAEPEMLDYNPEEGWDDQTEPKGIVLDFPSGEEVEKRVAFTARMLKPQAAVGANFLFQKIFGDGSFMAAGQLVIPPGGSKPTKSTKDNAFIFYLIEGAVNFRVHRSNFLLTTGGMFLVPRGNMYLIQNISDRDAKLFFAQARKVASEELEVRDDSRSRSPTFVNPPSRAAS